MSAVAPAKRFSVVHACEADALPARHVASLGLIDVEARAGGSHVGLPHDLYMVTAYCDERLACRGPGESGSLRVTVSALRTRSVSFDTLGEGQLAVALLTPLGLLRAFACPFGDLTNLRLPLGELVSAPAEAQLHAALVDAPGGPQRSNVFGRWLETRITERRCLGWQAERVGAAAMSLLHDEAKRRSIDELARCHAVSRRQLERDFRRWMGVTPGSYARLARFRGAAAAVVDGVPLAHAATDHGYADQAHMSRAFGEFAGLTPRQVRERGQTASASTLRTAFAGRVIMLPPGASPAAH